MLDAERIKQSRAVGLARLVGFAVAPLISYVVLSFPEDTIDGFKAWMGRKGRPAAVVGAAAIGGALTARGVNTLL